MTLTWREELTLRIERVKANMDRDIEELNELLDQVQEKVLQEDRELRQLRAEKASRKALIKDLKPHPDQKPLEKTVPAEESETEPADRGA